MLFLLCYRLSHCVYTFSVFVAGDCFVCLSHASYIYPFVVLLSRAVVWSFLEQGCSQPHKFASPALPHHAPTNDNSNTYTTYNKHNNNNNTQKGKQQTCTIIMCMCSTHVCMVCVHFPLLLCCPLISTPVDLPQHTQHTQSTETRKYTCTASRFVCSCLLCVYIMLCALYVCVLCVCAVCRVVVASWASSHNSYSRIQQWLH